MKNQSTFEPSDEELLRIAAAGHQRAYGALVRRHSNAILGFLVNMLRNRELAEEVLQEVFLQAWRTADQFDATRSSVRSWLFLLARSRAVDSVRSQEARRRREHNRAEEDQRQSDNDPRTRLEAKATVERLLHVLSPEQRECVSMAFFGGLSIAQVAERLDIPLGTAKSRYLYGMRKLRDASGDLLGEEAS